MPLTKCFLTSAVLLAFALGAQPGKADYGLLSDNGGLIEISLDNPATRQTILGTTAPDRAIVAEDQRAAYAIQANPAQLVVIDLITAKPHQISPDAGAFSHLTDIDIAPNQRIAYVVDFGAAKIYPVDLIAGKVLAPFAGTGTPYSLDISPDGSTAWVASNDGRIIRLNLTNGNTEAEINLPSPVEIEVAWGAGIAFVTDSTTTPKLSRVVLATGSMTRQDFGAMPGAMVLSQDEASLYVTGFSNKLTKVDVKTGTLSSQAILPGTQPADLATRPVSIRMRTNGRQLELGYGAEIQRYDTSLLLLGRDTGFTNVRVLALEGKTFLPSVYFIGDSVTAGFGYCGAGDTGRLSTCGVNNAFSNAWTPVDGTYPLSYCAPPKTGPLTNYCSNNDADGKGQPWTSPPWSPNEPRPTVAYAFRIANVQGESAEYGGPATIYNWAVTGSTPAHWDSGSDAMVTSAGPYGNVLDRIVDSHVVMTLGANPILSEYLNVGYPLIPSLVKGECVDSTTPGGLAASLDDEPAHMGDADGVAKCLEDKWDENLQTQHLYSIYTTLLKNGNRVLVMGYPPVCPWSFGKWQPAPNAARGPAQGYDCTTQSKAAFNPNMPGTTITQAQQAFYLAGLANDKIRDAVTVMASPDLVFVPPSPEWVNHQAWTNDSWIFLNDTWVHPSVEGHKQLAVGVVTAMCASFGHWCRNDAGYPTWYLPREF